MFNHLKELSSKKCVIYAGDLNVAHHDIDIYNPDAKHISKQAGLTPEERNSFSNFLSMGFTDTFRYFYPGNC